MNHHRNGHSSTRAQRVTRRVMRAIAGIIAAGGLAVDLVKAAREDVRDLSRLPNKEDDVVAWERVEILDRQVRGLLVELDAAWEVVGEGYSEDLARAIQALVDDKLAKQRAEIAQSFRVAASHFKDMPIKITVPEALLEAASGVELGNYELSTERAA